MLAHSDYYLATFSNHGHDGSMKKSKAKKAKEVVGIMNGTGMAVFKTSSGRLVASKTQRAELRFPYHRPAFCAALV